MKIYNTLILLSILVNLSCEDVSKKKELASDRVIHIEDSIHYSIPYLPRLCDSMELEKRFVNIGDCTLYVELEGEGIPIVLINGGPGGTHHYFHPEFSRIKDRHRIIYYDQRGTGQSDFEKGDRYSFEQAVDDLEKLRIQLSIEEWVVCGYSYGGGLAQFYALKYPENVLGLALISALPMFEHEHFNGDQELYISKEEKEKKNEVIRAYIKGELKMKPFLYNLALNGDWKRQSYYKPTKEQMIRSALYEWHNDKEFNSIMSESYKAFNLEGVFKNCPIPTIIFEGKNDLTWGDKKAETFISNHPNAEYVLFKKSGHSIFSDEPKKFFRQLENFTHSLTSVSSNLIEKRKKVLEFNIN